MNSPYQIDFPEGAASIVRISSLFARNGNPKSSGHLTWQYLDSPGGGHITAFAITRDGKDAAVYSVFLIPFLHNGDRIIAAQSLDTLTDKDHRGQGLFTLLANAVYERCRERNIQFVYGFPNAHSGPGFFGKLGWIELGSPPFIFKIFNHGYLINRLSRGRFQPKFPNLHALLFSDIKVAAQEGDYSALSIETFDNDYDELWKKCNARAKITVDRTSKYMNWRYIACPRKIYDIVAVYRRGLIEAVCVSTVVEKHQGRVGYIMDVIHNPDAPFAATLALQSTLSRMRNQNADIALAWNAPTTKLHESYRAQGFRQLHRIFQPIKLFFGTKSTSQFPAQSIDKDAFFISYADSDTV